MDIAYIPNGQLTPKEMNSLASKIGSIHDRPVERNQKAIENSLFIATGRVGENSSDLFVY